MTRFSCWIGLDSFQAPLAAGVDWVAAGVDWDFSWLIDRPAAGLIAWKRGRSSSNRTKAGFTWALIAALQEFDLSCSDRLELDSMIERQRGIALQMQSLRSAGHG